MLNGAAENLTNDFCCQVCKKSHIQKKAYSDAFKLFIQHKFFMPVWSLLAYNGKFTSNLFHSLRSHFCGLLVGVVPRAEDVSDEVA